MLVVYRCGGKRNHTWEIRDVCICEQIQGCGEGFPQMRKLCYGRMFDGKMCGMLCFCSLLDITPECRLQSRPCQTMPNLPSNIDVNECRLTCKHEPTQSHVVPHLKSIPRFSYTGTCGLPCQICRHYVRIDVFQGLLRSYLALRHGHHTSASTSISYPLRCAPR